MLALFTKPTLNSLAAAGESATGRALSPVFAIEDPTSQQIGINYQGGHGTKTDTDPALCIRLLDAESGEVVDWLPPPSSHSLSPSVLSLKKAKGKKFQIEIIDKDTNTGYAWIGITGIELKPLSKAQ
jgi:hypothetical protein